MDSVMYSNTDVRSCARNEPCTHACMESAVEQGMELPSKNGCCPRGFSSLQVAIIGVLKAYRQVIAHWQIAKLVGSCYGIAATEGAVRGALDRMYPRNFLTRSRASSGRLKGNIYTFTADPCPHIRLYAAMESAMWVDTGPNMHPVSLEKKDRKKNLSISSENRDCGSLEALTEADMEFYWPNLAGSGFGTHQIRQIIQRLTQQMLSLSKVRQGLEHAEWELEHGLMKAKDGKVIDSPQKWVFKILATQGYYPRPAGYVSPQEQAERDAAEERKRIAAASEERLKAECDSWIAGLSQDERSAILEVQNGKFRIPDDAFLRSHFRAAVWPKRQSVGGK